jgi:hypothetical protein
MLRWQSILAFAAVCAATFVSVSLGLLWFGHAGLSVSEQALRTGIATWAGVSIVACLLLAVWGVRSKRLAPMVLLCATPFVLAQPGVYLLLRYGQ